MRSDEARAVLAVAVVSVFQKDTAGVADITAPIQGGPVNNGFDYFFGTPTSNDGLVNLYRNEELIEPKSDMSLAGSRIGILNRLRRKSGSRAGAATLLAHFRIDRMLLAFVLQCIFRQLIDKIPAFQHVE